MKRRGASRRSVADDGGAIVEFIGLSLLLLVPIVYLVVTLARVQAGAYAAELAARESSRGAAVEGVAVLDAGGTIADARAVAGARAEATAALVMADFGFGPHDGIVDLSCVAGPCFAPGSEIRSDVAVTVVLPGVPGFLRGWLPLAITLRAGSESPIDDFAGDST